MPARGPGATDHRGAATARADSACHDLKLRSDVFEVMGFGCIGSIASLTDPFYSALGLLEAVFTSLMRIILLAVDTYIVIGCPAQVRMCQRDKLALPAPSTESYLDFVHGLSTFFQT